MFLFVSTLISQTIQVLENKLLLTYGLLLGFENHLVCFSFSYIVVKNSNMHGCNNLYIRF